MKIRKLLALGGSLNPAEARSARIMAEKLMKKHNLFLGEIESPGTIVEKVVRRFNRIRQWQDKINSPRVCHLLTHPYDIVGYDHYSWQDKWNLTK